MHQDATWSGCRPQPRGLCVRWRPSPPSPKGGGAFPPIFGPCLSWPNGWMHQDATWYEVRPQPRRLCVRWGPSPLPQKGRRSTQFSAHVYCGQTAAWIKMPLGMEVGLGLRDIVFDVHPATPETSSHPPPPIFGSCLLWPNGWMDEDAAWYGSRPLAEVYFRTKRTMPHCARRDPSSRERGTTAPLFSAHVYCGHRRPSQLLLSSCFYFNMEPR